MARGRARAGNPPPGTTRHARDTARARSPRRRLRRPWRDGTRAICFEPSEFLEKLAVVIPRPRINLLIYHGAFAPRGRCHSGPVVVEDAPYRVLGTDFAAASLRPAEGSGGFMLVAETTRSTGDALVVSGSTAINLHSRGGAAAADVIALQSSPPWQLTLGGEAAEYAGCPEALSLQTLLDGAIVDLGADGAVQHELSTILVLITCAQNPAGTAGSTLSLAVTDELGFTLSTGVNVTSQRVSPISLLDTSVPAQSIFSARASLTGNIRIRPSSSSGGILARAIQSHADPNDATRVHRTALRPQLVGQRTAADVVDLVIPTPVPPCGGDCDGGGTVQIGELVTGVNIALGEAPLSACVAFDRDNSGGVAIGELIAAVNNALEGCD